ncbi:hypothetical protein [Mycobacterium sp. NS-7484]|nr:hypothetical protein [Mycobacterium sp. NS-7484]
MTDCNQRGSVNSCLYPRRDPNTACGYAHAERIDTTEEFETDE